MSDIAVPQADPIDVMARTIWAEARGEGYAGMTAIALIIKNRADNPRWWGHGVVGVCKAHQQFTCWNEGDPNRKACMMVDQRDAAFRDALAIAAKVAAGHVFDVTNGADSYHANSITKPYWAVGKMPVAIIGHHNFYRIELK